MTKEEKSSQASTEEQKNTEESVEKKLYDNDDSKEEKSEEEKAEEEKSANEAKEKEDKESKEAEEKEDEEKKSEDEKKKVKEDEKNKPSITELNDAAIAAVEKWQADPTPENKKFADKAVSDAKQLVEDTKKAEIKYDIKLPEKSLLSKDSVEKIVIFARERGLSNEVAQDIITRENQAIGEYSASALAQMDELVSVEWPKKAAEDKEIGGDNFGKNAELSKRVLEKFGSQEFRNILDKRTEENPNGMGYGNHPEVLRFFVKIGKAMGDDNIMLSNSRGEEPQSAADKFYDKSS